jgi:ATP-dependent DNA helicase RecG
MLTSIRKIIAQGEGISTKQYTKGKDPQLIEDDIFNIVIPLSGIATEQAAEQAAEQVTEQAAEQVTEQALCVLENGILKGLLEFCLEPKTAKEVIGFLGLKHREHFRSEILNPLLERKILKKTIPEKPTSPRQKYYTNPNRNNLDI